MKNESGSFGHYCYVSDSLFVPRTWGWRPENIKKRLVFLSTSDRFIFQDSIWAVGEEIKTSKIRWKRQADLRLFVQFGRFRIVSLIVSQNKTNIALLFKWSWSCFISYHFHYTSPIPICNKHIWIENTNKVVSLNCRRLKNASINCQNTRRGISHK